MKKERVVGISRVYFDLAKVKSFAIKGNGLLIELYPRVEYILNPAIDEWEREIFNDTIEIENPDYEAAKEDANNLALLLQEYLNEVI